MRSKLYLIMPVLITLILVFSIITVSAEFSEGIRTKFFDRDTIFERVIADDVDKERIESFMERGCSLIHKLKRSSSFECPKDIVPRLNVRKSRIFHIMDLDADQQTGADKVWAEGITGIGVNVAVLDTGIDTDHPELQDSYLGGYDFVDNDPVPEDDHGHGTHVAGIITSNGGIDGDSKGVSPSTGVYMYKVCDADGYCFEDDMTAAMEAAVETDAKIISISIGGGSYTGENCDSDYLADRVNWVVSQGLTAVVAAGNNGRGVSSPGCASGAIAVGAVDSVNNVPYWSGRGEALDILAPGVSIYSTYLNGGYQYMSGTSMATPHVAGVVSLLLETDPTLTTSEIKTAIYGTTNPANKCYVCTMWWGYRCFRQAETTCTPEITGAGVVNAYDAYLALKPSGPECLADGDCDDGLYCNGAETCVSGSCQSGTSIDCSHVSDQCNEGICDETNDVCTNQPKPDGTLCNDDLFCSVNETCQAGVCTLGSAMDCDDSDICTADSCNEATDSCEHSPAAADGTPCDDGQFCTINDACTSGVCNGVAKDCSDEVACTTDSCNEASDACENTPDDSFCENGLFCDGAETCNPLLGCQAGTPVVCNDDNECTIDACNEGIDACEYANAADYTACTGGFCCGGVCSSPICSLDADCDDSNACTTDTCNYPGTCESSCVNDPLTSCIDSDGCCPSGCDQTNDNDCQATTKCWSSEYTYIKRSSSQFKKFCKCAEGTYAYESYGYIWGRRTAHQYEDSEDNENWSTISSNTYFPAYRVRCTDGNWYYTNQDYYYG